MVQDRLPYPAYIRAFSFLASRHGNPVESGKSFRERKPSKSSKRYRIYRSLANPTVKYIESPEMEDFAKLDTPEAKDVMSILTARQPDVRPLARLRGKWLEPHAERILDLRQRLEWSEVSKQDVAALLAFFFSLEIRFGEKSGAVDLKVASSTDKDVVDHLVRAAMRRFGEDDNADMDWSTFDRVLRDHMV